MDFVSWCDIVLKTCIEVMKTSVEARAIGVNEYELAQALCTTLGIADFRRQEGNTYSAGMFGAITSLRAVDLIENNERSKSHWKVSRLGHQYMTNRIPLWSSICQEQIDAEHTQLLSLINRLSPQTASDHAWLVSVEHQTIVAELGNWPIHQIWNVARELYDWGYISGFFSLANTVRLEATYKGIVWETKRGFTLESKLIDDLVHEWETTSVDFKQYLYIKTVEQKAEFIKDVLSLVNTKASGRRWMIIGFHNKTHDYSSPPNQDLNQDNFERLLAEYTEPFVDVRYEVVDYRKGPVGRLEILRDPKKLPYRVSKGLGERLKGDKKQILEGQIFVRHGSQVAEAEGAELQALIEEGEQARRVS